MTADARRLEWWVTREARGGELRVLYHARELLPAWLRRHGRGATVLDVGPFRTRREAWRAVDRLLDTGSDVGTFGRPAEVREASPGDAIDRAIAERGALVDDAVVCPVCRAARPRWYFGPPLLPCAECRGHTFTPAEVALILAADRQGRPEGAERLRRQGRATPPVLSDPDTRPREEGGP